MEATVYAFVYGLPRSMQAPWWAPWLRRQEFFPREPLGRQTISEHTQLQMAQDRTGRRLLGVGAGLSCQGHRITVMALGEDAQKCEPLERLFLLQKNETGEVEGRRVCLQNLEEAGAVIPIMRQWGAGTGGSAGLCVL